MGEHKRPKHQIGDAPIQPELIQVMNVLARALDEVLNGKPPLPPMDYKKKWGFVLMCFPFDNFDGRCNYISNSDRADIKVLLKEQLARFEGMPETKGTG